MKSILSIILLFLSLSLLSCDGLFPSQAKDMVPADHTQNIGGALHAPGRRDPLGKSGACYSCHGNDLKGRVTVTNEGKTVAPSCFECHGALWEGGGNGGGGGGD
jgi:cytochrome c553